MCVSFCSLTKGISPKICILRVHVKINKPSFEPFLCLGHVTRCICHYDHAARVASCIGLCRTAAGRLRAAASGPATGTVPPHNGGGEPAGGAADDQILVLGHLRLL